MCLHVLLFPFTSWWKGTRGCYKSPLRSAGWHSHAIAGFPTVLDSFWSRCYFCASVFRRCHSFHAADLALKSCEWLRVRWAERLIELSEQQEGLLSVKNVAGTLDGFSRMSRLCLTFSRVWNKLTNQLVSVSMTKTPVPPEQWERWEGESWEWCEKQEHGNISCPNTDGNTHIIRLECLESFHFLSALCLDLLWKGNTTTPICPEVVFRASDSCRDNYTQMKQSAGGGVE